MAPKAPEVKVRITAQDETAKGLDQVTRRLDRTVGYAKGVLASVIGGAIGSFLKSAVDKSVDAERSFQNTAAALSNVGVNADRVRPQIEKVVNQLSRMSGRDDDEILAGLAELITLTGSYDKAMRLLPMTLDVAVGKHKTVGEAATLVGKVYNGNTTALQKMGLTIKSGEDGIDLLRKKYKGFAEQEGQSIIGTFGRIQVAYNNVLEALGKSLLSGAQRSGASGTIIDQLNALEQWITEHSAEVQGFVGLLAKLAEGMLRVAGAIGEIASKAQGATDWLEKHNPLLNSASRTRNPDGSTTLDWGSGNKVMLNVPPGLPLAGLARMGTHQRLSLAQLAGLGAHGDGLPDASGLHAPETEQQRDKRWSDEKKQLELLKSGAANQITFQKSTEQLRALEVAYQKAVANTNLSLEERAQKANLLAQVQGLLYPDAQHALRVERAGGGNRTAGMGGDTSALDAANAGGGFLNSDTKFGSADATGTAGQGFASGFANVLGSDAQKPLANIGEALGELTATAVPAFAQSFTDAFQAIIDGSKGVGAAIFDAIRQAVGRSALAEGSLNVARAIESLAHGVLGHPGAFAAAAKFGEAAAADFAVAAAMGIGGGKGRGAGGGGGGGGGYGANYSQQSAQLQNRPKTTLIIQGGLLNMRDPAQRDALTDAIKELGLTRDLEIQVVG